MKLSSTFALATILGDAAPRTNAFSVSSTRVIQTSRVNQIKLQPLFSTEDDGDAPSDVSPDDAIAAEAKEVEVEVKAPIDVLDDKPATATATAFACPPIMSTEEKDKLLQKMLILASSTDRGQFASSTENESMLSYISQIEQSYGDDAEFSPTTTSQMEGTWELLYSSTQLFRSSPFFMAGRAVCKDGEEAERYDWFCDMHRAALAISEIGKVRQIISSDRMVSEFEVNVGSVPFLSDLTPFKYSGGLPFTINGAIVSSADITPTNGGKGWEIFMDQVEIKGSNIPLLRSILEDDRVALKSRKLGSFLEENVDSYSNPKPVFETTYLDDDIRISKDQDGKVFVYGKMSDSTEPTEYKSIEADLGLLGLLEGLNDNFFKFSM